MRFINNTTQSKIHHDDDCDDSDNESFVTAVGKLYDDVLYLSKLSNELAERPIIPKTDGRPPLPPPHTSHNNRTTRIRMNNDLQNPFQSDAKCIRNVSCDDSSYLLSMGTSLDSDLSLMSEYEDSTHHHNWLSSKSAKRRNGHDYNSQVTATTVDQSYSFIEDDTFISKFNHHDNVVIFDGDADLETALNNLSLQDGCSPVRKSISSCQF